MQFEFTAFPRGTEGRARAAACAAPVARRASSTAAPTSPQPIELDHNALIHALQARKRFTRRS